MDTQDNMVAAVCKVCGRQLTVLEFRACSGLGHFCGDHLPAGPAPDRSISRGRAQAGTGSGGSRSRRQVTPLGPADYPCKGQFARDGVIRRGRLLSNHPSCPGRVAFVCKDIAYGPGEVVLLFIRSAEGRALAERCGFSCHR
ncbi:MAG: hypothetical protein JXB13_17730 [Phycisphaerae bacterium]|nr:hypothetical protein [Phycisphaerae bacterium]